MAREYKNILLELGVDYSPIKTFTSKRGFEFAKRLFKDGKEMSPIPLTAIQESLNSWSCLVETLKQIDDRGFSFIKTCRNPDPFLSLYLAYGKPLRLATQLANRSASYLKFFKGLTESQTVGDYLKQVSQWFGYSMSCNISSETLGK